MGDEKKSKGKAADDSKGKKGKKGKGKGKGSAEGGLSVATHPRAGVQIRRAKGWGGLAGFVIGGYLSYQAGIALPMVLLRAVAFGIASYMVFWFCALTIWRQMLLAELRAMSDRQTPAPAGGADDGG